MIATRTARAALFGLVGVLAGLALPTVAAARWPTVSTVASMRSSSLDVRPGDQAGSAAAPRPGETESRQGQVPVVGHLPALNRDLTMASVLLLVVGALSAAVILVGRTPARAPPLNSFPS